MRPIVEPTGKAHAVSTWRLDPINLKFFIRGSLTYERTLPFGRDITMPQGRLRNTQSISFQLISYKNWNCILLPYICYCIFYLLSLLRKRNVLIPCVLRSDWDAALHPSAELFQRHGEQPARYPEGRQERRVWLQLRDDDAATFAPFAVFFLAFDHYHPTLWMYDRSPLTKRYQQLMISDRFIPFP